ARTPARARKQGAECPECDCERDEHTKLSSVRPRFRTHRENVSAHVSSSHPPKVGDAVQKTELVGLGGSPPLRRRRRAGESGLDLLRPAVRSSQRRRSDAPSPWTR